ncbi:MAG TPA: HutD family protein [Pseudoxanthomonas sp.]|nr:HutD family protein [Pseudoxanthomonas sp.]
MFPGPLLHLPAHEYRRERWRNGAGWTREILALPHASDWALRLSVAEIESPTAFSSFPGVEREQVLLSGNGLRLEFGGSEATTLLPPYQRCRFAGACAPTGVPLDGPVQVFNLMWRPALLEARLLHRPLVGGMLCFGGEATAWAVYLLGGSARIVEDGGDCRLEAGDTAWLPGGMRRRYVIEGAGEALMVRFDRAGTGPDASPAP